MFFFHRQILLDFTMYTISMLAFTVCLYKNKKHTVCVRVNVAHLQVVQGAGHAEAFGAPKGASG